MAFRWIRQRNRQRGNALVELAFITPVVLLLCGGVMDFSRAIYAGIAIANAARAGVQYGALTPGNSGKFQGMADAAVADAANQGLTGVTATARNFCRCVSSTTETACSSTCGGSTASGYVEVTVNYTYNTLMQIPGVPTTVVLNKTARMRVQ